MLENYDFIDERVMAYFKRRLTQAPRDADFALDYIKTHARDAAPSRRPASPRCDSNATCLWAQLDALNHAYVTPGVIPPGAFRPRKAMTEQLHAQRYRRRRGSRPAFPRYARLHRIASRERFVILAPERAYEIDAIGARGAEALRRRA